MATTKKKTKRKTFTKEQKTRALQMLRDGMTQAEVAKKIGCSKNSVTSWVAQAKQEGGAVKGDSPEARIRAHIAGIEAELKTLTAQKREVMRLAAKLQNQ